MHHLNPYPQGFTSAETVAGGTAQVAAPNPHMRANINPADDFLTVFPTQDLQDSFPALDFDQNPLGPNAATSVFDASQFESLHPLNQELDFGSRIVPNAPVGVATAAPPPVPAAPVPAVSVEVVPAAPAPPTQPTPVPTSTRLTRSQSRAQQQAASQRPAPPSIFLPSRPRGVSSAERRPLPPLVLPSQPRQAEQPGVNRNQSAPEPTSPGAKRRRAATQSGNPAQSVAVKPTSGRSRSASTTSTTQAGTAQWDAMSVDTNVDSTSGLPVPGKKRKRTDVPYFQRKEKCEQCGKEMSTKNMQRHIDSKHLGKRHQCPFCEVDFSAPGDINRHISHAHPEVYVRLAAGESRQQVAESMNLSAAGSTRVNRKRNAQPGGSQAPAVVPQTAPAPPRTTDTVPTQTTPAPTAAASYQPVPVPSQSNFSMPPRPAAPEAQMVDTLWPSFGGASQPEMNLMPQQGNHHDGENRQAAFNFNTGGLPHWPGSDIMAYGTPGANMDRFSQLSQTNTFGYAMEDVAMPPDLQCHTGITTHFDNAAISPTSWQNPSYLNHLLSQQTTVYDYYLNPHTLDDGLEFHQQLHLPQDFDTPVYQRTDVSLYLSRPAQVSESQPDTTGERGF